MSVTALAGFALVAVALLAVVLNHCQARLALVELALNEGLPPGYEAGAGQSADAVTRGDMPGTPAASRTAGDVAVALGTGVHVFLSRNCHACQRLIDELEQVTLVVDAPLHFRYVDRPRPIAAIAAESQGAELHDHDADMAQRVEADPLPFTIAVGDHELTSRAVTPTVHQVLVAARDAGIRAETAGALR